MICRGYSVIPAGRVLPALFFLNRDNIPESTGVLREPLVMQQSQAFFVLY